MPQRVVRRLLLLLVLLAPIAVAGGTPQVGGSTVAAQGEHRFDRDDLRFALLAPGDILLWWNGAVWSATGEPGPGPAERVALGDGRIAVEMEVVAGTAAGCLADHLAALAADPAVANVRLLADPEGTAWFAAGPAVRANVAFERGASGVARQEGASPIVTVASIGCSASWSTGGALKQVRTGPAAVAEDVIFDSGLNQSYGVWPPGPGLAQASLLAPVWDRLAIGGFSWTIGSGQGQGAVADATLQGAVDDPRLGRPPGQRYAALTVEITGLGDDAGAAPPATVDPRRFALRDATGRLHDAAFFRWEAAPGDPAEQSQAVAADETARLVATFALPASAIVAEVVCRCAQPFDPGLPFAGYAADAVPLAPAPERWLQGAPFPLIADDAKVAVALSNPGPRPLQLAPGDFLLSQPGRAGAPGPIAHRWLFPAPAGTGARTLAPGEIAVLWLDYGEAGFAQGDQILAVGDPTAPVVVAGYPGGAGGRSYPVVIDME